MASKINTPILQESPKLLRDVAFACGHCNGLIPLLPLDHYPELPWPTEHIDHNCHFCDLIKFRQSLDLVMKRYETRIAPLARRLRNNVQYMRSITPEGSALRKAHWSEMMEMRIDFVRVVEEGDEKWTARWGLDTDGGLVERYFDRALALGEEGLN